MMGATVQLEIVVVIVTGLIFLTHVLYRVLQSIIMMRREARDHVVVRPGGSGTTPFGSSSNGFDGPNDVADGMTGGGIRGMDLPVS